MAKYWLIKSLTIKRGDLQFVAYSHQKHRFTSPVRTVIYVLT